MKTNRIINDDGEVFEENNENMALAKREINELAILNEWLEKKAQLMAAEQQFKMVDKPFRKVIKEIFEKYSIKKLENDYVQIILKNGFQKKAWRDEELIALIERHGMNVDDFKEITWVDGTITIKYKE